MSRIKGMSSKGPNRLYAELLYAKPDGEDVLIKMRANYYDASSKTGYTPLDNKQLESLAEGKPIYLEYDTSSGVHRSGFYELGLRSSKFNTYGYAPVPIDEKSLSELDKAKLIQDFKDIQAVKTAEVNKAKIAAALDAGNRVNKNSTMLQDEKQ